MDAMWPAVVGGCYYPSDKIIALPRESFGLELFFYNKNIFEEAGVDTPDVDYEAGNWTWDVWRQKAMELTKFSDDGRREIVGASTWGGGYWELPLIMPSHGVSMFNDDLTHFNIDDPKIIKHFEMVEQMTNDDRSLGKPEETQEFDWASSGKQAIVHDATWSIPNFQTTWIDFDWDFVPPPKGECCHTNIVGSDYHSVNGADYADKEGGWEIVKFLNSAREDLWWASNFFGAPFHKDSVEEWRDKLNATIPLNGWKYMMEMTESAVPWAAIPFQDQLDTILNNEIGQAILGERPVEEVCVSIATQVEDMIAEFE
jgi:multiple sugar transport system substrate-binding protein